VLSVAPLVELLAAPGVPVMWWADRALGMLAYVALWLSTLFGVMVGSRGAGGLLDRATVLQLHSRWALVALSATGLHVLTVVGDPYSGISPLAVFVPGVAEKLTVPVTLGTFALYGLVSLGLATYLADRIPKAVWRAIHATAFGTYLLALAHGVLAGSETQLLAVRALYIGTAAVLVAAVLQRVLLSLLPSTSKIGPAS
jgi:sulfoxide reductase heme-binding subunit YedZ